MDALPWTPILASTGILMALVSCFVGTASEAGEFGLVGAARDHDGAAARSLSGHRPRRGGWNRLGIEPPVTGEVAS